MEAWKNRRQYRGCRYVRSTTEKAKFQRGTMAELFAIPAVVITDTLRRLVIFYEDTKITCSNDCRVTLRVRFRRGLAALLSDPGSDLSSLKGNYNLEAAARLDARLFAQAHKRKAHGNNCLGIGLEHAVMHHLKGKAIDVYALAFDAACSAFFEK
jgi:hypothetical protein